MMSALECYNRANHCEKMAAKMESETNRTLLLSLVKQWNQLGDTAEAHAAKLRRSYATALFPTIHKA